MDKIEKRRVYLLEYNRQWRLKNKDKNGKKN